MVANANVGPGTNRKLQAHIDLIDPLEGSLPFLNAFCGLFNQKCFMVKQQDKLDDSYLWIQLIKKTIKYFYDHSAKDTH